MPIRKAVYLYLVCSKLEGNRYYEQEAACLADLLKRYKSDVVDWGALEYYHAYWERAINPLKATPYLAALACFRDWLVANRLLEVPKLEL